MVGGGAAGLAAAWRLASSGAHVSVFERAPVLGGRMRSEQLDGCHIDTGAQLFGSGFSALFRIAREVGAESLLVRSPGNDALFRDGRIHPIHYGSVTSMIRSHALPTTLKLKLGARYVPFLLRHARELDAGDPLSAGGDKLDTESVAAWGTRELGKDFVELLAYPLLGAYYGSTPERTSTALYHALARAGLDVTVHAVRGGTSALIQAIADAARDRGAEIHTNAHVTRVLRGDGSVRVVQGEKTDEFDGVILALPAPQLRSLIELPASVAAWLENVQFSPAAVLALVLKQRMRADFFGLSMARGEREVRDLVAICVESQKAPGLVPAERGLLVCLSSPDASPALLEQPERAVDRMIAAAQHVFPGLRGTITRAKLYRHPYGYPIFYPGYLKHLRKFPTEALPPNVRLAGDYLVSPTVDGALRSGDRAARALTV